MTPRELVQAAYPGAKVRGVTWPEISTEAGPIHYLGKIRGVTYLLFTAKTGSLAKRAATIEGAQRVGIKFVLLPLRRSSTVRGKTVCLRGHSLLVEENVRIGVSRGRKQTQCLTCVRDRRAAIAASS